MPKVLHVSFLWDDETVNQRHSDYILAMGWIKAGWDVLYFDYRLVGEEIGNEKMNNALMNIILKHNPDIVFFTKSEGGSRRFSRRTASCQIDPNIISSVKQNGFKGIFVHWFLDQRYEYFKSSLDLGSQCDWFFYVAQGERLEQYSKKMKTPASYIIAPYEPSFMKPQPFNRRNIDLIWMGGAHKPTRNKFEDTRYETLQSLIHANVLTEYYGCFNKGKIWCPQYQAMLGRSKMGLSLYAFDRPLYFSNRLSHIIGSGTALFSYDFKNREKLFNNDEGIFFKTIDEFKKKKNYYINNLDELQWVAENGHKKAKQYFTSSNVVNEILATLNSGQSQLPFGQTYNPQQLQYEINTSEKEYGEIQYIDCHEKIYSIEQYSNVIQKTTPQKQPKEQSKEQYRRENARKIKELHQQKQNIRLAQKSNIQSSKRRAFLK